MLAVAEAALTVTQIEGTAGSPPSAGRPCTTALDQAPPAAAGSAGRYRFDHASTADFLLDKQAAGALWVDPARWHPDHGLRVRRARGGRELGNADPYLLTYLPAHAEAAGRLDDLIEDPRFLIAPGLDLGDRGILSVLGLAGRAKPIVPVIRLVLPMLRDRQPGTLPHLHLYATQAHLPPSRTG